MAPKRHNYRIQQTPLSFPQEIITDIKEMVIGKMKEFYRRNHGVKPERILFYRDGVSEGQFQSVSVGSNSKVFDYLHDQVHCICYIQSCIL